MQLNEIEKKEEELIDEIKIVWDSYLNEEQKNNRQEFLVTSVGHSFNQTKTFEFI